MNTVTGFNINIVGFRKRPSSETDEFFYEQSRGLLAIGLVKKYN